MGLNWRKKSALCDIQNVFLFFYLIVFVDMWKSHTGVSVAAVCDFYYMDCVYMVGMAAKHAASGVSFWVGLLMKSL